MAIIQKSLASLYETKLTRIRETLRREQGENRRILENAGFTVEYEDQPARPEAAQNLIAAKGGVVLRVSQLLRGGKTFAVTVKDGGREKTMRLLTDKLVEAIAFADAARYLAK